MSTETLSTANTWRIALSTCQVLSSTTSRWPKTSMGISYTSIGRAGYSLSSSTQLEAARRDRRSGCRSVNLIGQAICSFHPLIGSSDSQKMSTIQLTWFHLTIKMHSNRQIGHRLLWAILILGIHQFRLVTHSSIVSSSSIQSHKFMKSRHLVFGSLTNLLILEASSYSLFCSSATPVGRFKKSSISQN